MAENSGKGSIRNLRALSRQDVQDRRGSLRRSSQPRALTAERKSSGAVKSSGKIVTINCGGTLHSIDPAILVRFPDTMLAKAVRGAVEFPRDGQGNLFFDRHPRIFPDILNFYRTGGAVLTPNPQTTQKAFDEEIHFFGLTDCSPESEVVTVNCGGRKYMVQITTLAKYPDTFLGRLATGQIDFDNLPRDQAGNLFLDRDQDVFGAVLNYYRTDGKVLERGSNTSQAMWNAELSFYGLDNLITSIVNLDDAKFIRRMTATRRPTEAPLPEGSTSSDVRRRASTSFMPPPRGSLEEVVQRKASAIPPPPTRDTTQLLSHKKNAKSTQLPNARQLFQEKASSWKDNELTHADIFDFLGYDSGLIVWKHSKANAGYGPRRLFVDVDLNAICWAKAKDKRDNSKVSKILMRDIKTIEIGLCTEVLSMTASYENARTRLDEDALIDDPTSKKNKGYFAIISVDREVSFEARSTEHMQKIVYFIRKARELKMGPLLWSPPSVAHTHAADLSRQRSFKWIADHDSKFANDMGVSKAVLDGVED